MKEIKEIKKGNEEADKARTEDALNVNCSSNTILYFINMLVMYARF